MNRKTSPQPEPQKRKQVSVAGVPEDLFVKFQIASIRARVPFNQWAVAAWAMFADDTSPLLGKPQYLEMAGEALRKAKGAK